MNERLAQLYEALSARDLVEILVLALAIYVVLRLLGRTRGAGLVRGLGLVVIGLFLLAQVVIASFDLTVLARVLDYTLTAQLVGLLVIFQPELRRGLMVLGRYRAMRFFVQDKQPPLADKLADAAEALSRDCVGALIAVERTMALSAYVETGEAIDAELSAPLLRALFTHRSPLHDGAVILRRGRVAAAGCQLPLGQPPEDPDAHTGMRHRAALCLSDETDAVLLVVSEETGRVSLAVGGVLEPVPRENLSRRLAATLSDDPKPGVRNRESGVRKPKSAA